MRRERREMKVREELKIMRTLFLSRGIREGAHLSHSLWHECLSSSISSLLWVEKKRKKKKRLWDIDVCDLEGGREREKRD